MNFYIFYQHKHFYKLFFEHYKQFWDILQYLKLCHQLVIPKYIIQESPAMEIMAWCNKSGKVNGNDCAFFLNVKVWTITLYTETVIQKCSAKKVLLKISQNSEKKACVWVSFLIKSHVYNFIKKGALAQNFPVNFV